MIENLLWGSFMVLCCIGLARLYGVLLSGGTHSRRKGNLMTETDYRLQAQELVEHPDRLRAVIDLISMIYSYPEEPLEVQTWALRAWHLLDGTLQD
jgi:hypothetical protein